MGPEYTPAAEKDQADRAPRATALLFVQETCGMIGQVPHVVFPQSLIAQDDGTVKIHYDAADYVECLATGKLQDIMTACFEQ